MASRAGKSYTYREWKGYIMSVSKQIKWGAILSYLSIAVNIVAGLIYTPWMIDQIGKADYGLYTLANSLITLFLVDFGLGSAISRYVSKYRAEGRQDKIDNFLGAVYKLYLIIDAVIFVVLLVIYFLIDTIYIKLTPDELSKFKIVYLMAASFAVVNFPFVTFTGILNAYEKFIQLKLSDVVYRILLVGITVLALLLDYGLYSLVAVHAIVGLIQIAYKFFVIKTNLPLKVNFKHNERKLYKEIFSFSFWVTISTLAGRLIFNITPSILGVVANSAAIAIFGIVTTLEGYSYLITGAINGVFMPKISRIYEEENAEKNIMPLFLGVGKFQYALNGLIVVGFSVIGQQFINLWMGPDYTDAYIGIVLVMIPGMFYNALQIANTTMVVQKRVNIQAFVNLATGLCNIALSFFLSARFGVIGACISICVAYFVRAGALHVIYQKLMHFDIPAFVKNCYLRLSVPILITVSLGFLMNFILPNEGWLMLIIKGVIITILYLSLILLVGLNKTEKTNFFGFLKHRGK